MEKRTNADINALILAARGGDQSAFETLLHRYSPLIESLSLSFSSVTDTEDKDDFYQEACIAFYRAVEHFDVSQTQVEFGLYAKTCIRNRLLSFCRKLRHRDRIVGLDSETETACECDPSQSIVEKENFLALYQRIESLLSPYESRVWWLYLSGRTAKEIAVQGDREERSVHN
ncbi:MAG: sigma-70 family RNA polymerase sigma factor, partial [Clostridia bacterium]|nr:sigma-70 family RNA polymerase sigma factor [Clostridia bacterium]